MAVSFQNLSDVNSLLVAPNYLYRSPYDIPVDTAVKLAGPNPTGPNAVSSFSPALRGVAGDILGAVGSAVLSKTLSNLGGNVLGGLGKDIGAAIGDTFGTGVGDALTNILSGSPVDFDFRSSPNPQVGEEIIIRNWQHATKLFVDGNNRLLPKQGFLFHVAFESDYISSIPIREAGMLAKSVSLPRFTYDTKTCNAYNRPQIVQTKIKYDSITLSFFDDSAGVIHNILMNYNSYYFKDSSNGWGFDVNSGTEFFSAIKLYSLHQKRFTEYILVKPIIKSSKFGEHAGDSTSIMTVDITIEPQNILTRTGNVSEKDVSGFATLHYDNTTGPNADGYALTSTTGNYTSKKLDTKTAKSSTVDNVPIAPFKMSDSLTNLFSGATSGISNGISSAIPGSDMLTKAVSSTLPSIGGLSNISALSITAPNVSTADIVTGKATLGNMPLNGLSIPSVGVRF